MTQINDLAFKILKYHYPDLEIKQVLSYNGLEGNLRVELNGGEIVERVPKLFKYTKTIEPLTPYHISIGDTEMKLIKKVIRKEPGNHLSPMTIILNYNDLEINSGNRSAAIRSGRDFIESLKTGVFKPQNSFTKKYAEFVEDYIKRNTPDTSIRLLTDPHRISILGVDYSLIENLHDLNYIFKQNNLDFKIPLIDINDDNSDGEMTLDDVLTSDSFKPVKLKSIRNKFDTFKIIDNIVTDGEVLKVTLDPKLALLSKNEVVYTNGTISFVEDLERLNYLIKYSIKKKISFRKALSRHSGSKDLRNSKLLDYINIDRLNSIIK